MKKDDYRTEFEVNRQEIDLDEENNNGKIQSRTELHSKARKPKKNSVHRLINILLVLFTLIPIGILAFVISNWFSPGDNLSPKAEDSQFHVEMSKNTSEKKPDSSEKDAAMAEENEENEENEELKKQELEKEAQAKKEQKEQKEREEKEKKEKAEREQAELVKQEQARKAQEEQIKKEQAEQAKKEQEEQAKKEAEKPAARSHTVAAGETLYRISVNYYNSGDGVSKIMAANGLSSNEIVKGQKLIIP